MKHGVFRISNVTSDETSGAGAFGLGFSGRSNVRRFVDVSAATLRVFSRHLVSALCVCIVYTTMLLSESVLVVRERAKLYDPQATIEPVYSKRFLYLYEATASCEVLTERTSGGSEAEEDGEC